MADKKISDLVDGGAPQAADEFVVARAGTNNKLAWSSLSFSQSVQTQNAVDVSLSGNTAGALALVSSGTLTLAGGNNITVSQAGNAVTISGPNAAGAQTAISGISASDTLYTSGTVRITGVGGGVTVSSNTGQRIDISVAAQSVQPETQTFIGGISASDTLYTSGSVRFTGSQAITVRSGTGQLVVIDAPAQSVQPETQTFIGGISASNTLYTSGSVRFTGSQAVTVRSGTGQLVVIDVPAQTTQVETQTFVGGIAASNATYTSGTVQFTGVGGGVTVSSNTGQRVDISVAAQSVQPETQTFIGGISASNALYTSGSVRFTGSQAVTVRSGTGQLVVIDVPAQTTQVETQTFIGGISASDTLYTSGSVCFTGSNAITVRSGTGQLVVIDAPATSSLSATGIVSISTNGSTVSIGASESVQTQGIILAGVSTGGNTTGNTQVSSGTRLVFAGTNNITLSQATAANATTITISGGGGGAAISMWPNQALATSLFTMTGALFTTGATRTTYSATIHPMAIDQAIGFNMIRAPLQVSLSTSATNSNWSWSFGNSLGFYSHNAGTLSLVSSFSNVQWISYASAANSTNASATWQMSYGSGTDFSSSRTLSSANAGNSNFWSSVTDVTLGKWIPYMTGSASMPASQYFFAWALSSSSVGANVAALQAAGMASYYINVIQDVGMNTASSSAQWPLAGRVSMTQTNTAMPATIATADVVQSSAAGSIFNRSMYVNILSQFYAG